MNTHNMKQYCLLALLLMASTLSYAANWLKAGPYLQEVTSTGATIVFENTLPTFAWVELRKKGSVVVTKHFQDIDGQHQIYNEVKAGIPAVPLQNFIIRINNLTGITNYEYRICAQQIIEQRPYSSKIGDSYETEWFSFKTLNPSSTEHHLVVLNDMHNNAAQMEKLLNAADHTTADHIIFAGDMMDNMQMGATTAKKVEEPYSSFVNKCVSMFATGKAFEMLRGDCETQGDASYAFSKYFPHQSGRLYNAYRWGDLEVVFLDGGDAKADDEPLTKNMGNNLGMYSPYREDEAKWLKQVVESEEYKSARYRIVVCHFPIPNDKTDDEAAGTSHMEKLMLPILNKANVNLLVSGHSMPETYAMLPAGIKGNNFTTLIQGSNTATRLDITDGKLNVTLVDANGQKIYQTVIQ